MLVSFEEKLPLSFRDIGIAMEMFYCIMHVVCFNFILLHFYYFMNKVKKAVNLQKKTVFLLENISIR